MENEGQIYCIEVDRSGVGEEYIVLHKRFITPPTDAEVTAFLMEQDFGYDPKHCKFYCYSVLVSMSHS